jgi:hypothetical protein
MNLLSFCVLTTLALVYAGLTWAESETYHRWEKAIDGQKDTQAKVAYFDHVNALLDQMIRRMAVDSQNDPALAKLLKDRNINVVVDNSMAPRDAGLNAQPPAPDVDKPAQTPSATTPSHP